ncbi:segregation/condensation protein A [Streptomyces sp. NPDC048225]|uniref:segregation/condensation protein A n=1 Tax=Streptomyces sp. NPDC048225 TaxID=3365518 RepID=UPI00371CE06A
MTSNDAPTPGSGPRAGRRRALGRGPGERVAPPVTGEPPADADPPASADAQAPADAQASAGPSASAVLETSALPVVSAVPEASAGPEASAVPEAPAVPEASAVPETSVVLEAGRSGRLAVPAPGGAVVPPAGPEPSRTPAVPRPGTPPRAPAAPAETEPQGEPEPLEPEHGDGVFKVRLANFEGPFDLLLQLISKHKLDVTEVALSKVTDEFMAHIRAMGPDWDLDQTTEFLVVAATLLDLKAARLLPAAEVEDEADLALLEARDLLFARLLQYRAYKRIADIFNERLDAEARRYPRTVGLEPHHAELLPEVVISIGPEGFARLAVKAMQPKPKPQVYVEHIHAPLVSVQEQAGIVVARLKELGEASFRVLVQDTEDTLTVVARFLALLELYREKAVELDQETALGDLLVRWTGGDGDVQPAVTDEFDRPPEVPKEEQKA